MGILLFLDNHAHDTSPEEFLHYMLSGCKKNVFYTGNLLVKSKHVLGNVYQSRAKENGQN